MTLTEYQDKTIKGILRENGGATSSGTVAGTNASNVTYTPTQFPADALKKLSKKKKQWSVMVTPQLPEKKLVSFENYFNILVENKNWEDFSFKVFGRGLLENNFVADLSSYLTEAYDEEADTALNTLKETIISFLNSDPCKLYRHKIAEFSRHFGSNLNFGSSGKSLFTEQNISSNLSNIINFVTKYYKNDLGLLDIVNHSFTSGESLSNIEIFKQFDNLFSQDLTGYLGNIPFSYVAVIDMNFTSSEVLKIDNPALLQKLSSDSNFRVEGNSIYPATEGGFPINLCSLILQYLQGA